VLVRDLHRLGDKAACTGDNACELDRLRGDAGIRLYDDCQRLGRIASEADA
jgi:hypothetical protein